MFRFRVGNQLEQAASRAEREIPYMLTEEARQVLSFLHANPMVRLRQIETFVSGARGTIRVEGKVMAERTITTRITYDRLILPVRRKVLAFEWVNPPPEIYAMFLPKQKYARKRPEKGGIIVFLPRVTRRYVRRVRRVEREIVERVQENVFRRVVNTITGFVRRWFST